jgi:peptidoglycan/LPS O-acetylase OafA/YrhL
MSDTLIIKGVAICFMLWHHLFYTFSEYGDWVQNAAFLGKVCIAMFLFVSAYGLTIQYGKIEIHKFQAPRFSDTLKFQGKRFLKLYINYWVIFLLFVPIGVFFFHRSLQVAYGAQINQLKYLITDLLGMNGFQSYNITWWFYQVIIILYLIFPILYIAVKKLNIFILLLFFLILVYHDFIIPIVHLWLFPFALGISSALNKEKITSFLNRTDWKILFVCNLILLCSVAYLKLDEWLFGGLGMDGFFTVTLIFLIITTLRKVKIVTQVLQFLGKHSMNIFMIHTFIFYYFYSGFIYSFKYPALIFIVLLASSLCVSILIEYCKKMIGIYRLENKIIDLYLLTNPPKP